MRMIDEIEHLRDSQGALTSKLSAFQTELMGCASDTVTNKNEDKSFHVADATPPHHHYENIFGLRRMTKTKLFLSQRYFMHLIELLQVLRDSEAHMVQTLNDIKSQLCGANA